MEFNTQTTVGLFLGLVAAAVAALILSNVMAAATVLMMVAPSIVAFGLVMLLLGRRWGEFTATTASAE